MMRCTKPVALALGAVLTVGSAAAVAQSKKLYVYPQKGQSQSQQSKDEGECRTWAKNQSAVDPDAQPPPEQLGSHARGTTRGAARGAAGGAAVGAIAGDAGKGAAIGAVVGGVRGRRGSKAANSAQQAEAADSFGRAFAACMESRGYSVK